jgi:hypothetical protein
MTEAINHHHCYLYCSHCKNGAALKIEFPSEQIVFDTRSTHEGSLIELFSLLLALHMELEEHNGNSLEGIRKIMQGQTLHIRTQDITM